MIMHNKIKLLLKKNYNQYDIRNILNVLEQNGTFLFPALPNGLFPAANLSSSTTYTGYSNVWIRDNVFVAFAHYLHGHHETALKTIKTLAAFLIKHNWRIQQIVEGRLDINNPMNRPHIRFNGNDLSEINEKWAHAENDALGYFLWFFCLIHKESVLNISIEEIRLISLLVNYFNIIRYWQDEDSGHWEEERKIEASSIGVVTKSLVELKSFIISQKNYATIFSELNCLSELIDDLIEKGMCSLQQILPSECIQPEIHKKRRYDSALLFLIYPIDIVPEPLADQILKDVINNLQGDYGIRRYLGDSFWAADYKRLLRPENRTIDFSDNIAIRNQLHKNDMEAQWCIFDPIISIVYGIRYQKYKKIEDLNLQTHYFNRSLGHITHDGCEFGAYKCPELYYLESGNYIPNDTVPLLWTQANLWMAFKYMLENA